jgi:large subunit ribosomal protein L22
MAVKAVAKNVGISPKKMRRVLEVVRGQKVETALQILRFLPTTAAREVAKVVKSAANNAENNNMMSQGDLKIVSIHADPGVTLRRSRARSRGRSSRILKRTCHVTVLVDEEEGA